MYQDKTLTCIDCGADFIFTADEQEFYATHQLTNDPKRCKPCREKRKAMPRASRRQGPGGPGGGLDQGPAGGQGPRGSGMGESRPRYRIVCNACGQEDEVPFRPKEGREVFCRRCYAERQG